MVYRIYVEKRAEFAHEANSLLVELNELYSLNLERVRIINRYDAEDIDEELFERAVKNVFSEPQVDETFSAIDLSGAKSFAAEFLPGQFDQRADSAAQCIQLISKGKRPTVRTAKIYAFYGNLTEDDLKTIKAYVINPVESREASAELPETLKIVHPVPADVKVLDGFCKKERGELEQFAEEFSLAMDADDLMFCRDYFRSEKRDPTIAEIRVLDTYWSDHCRHTTFLTSIDKVTFADKTLQETYEEYLNAREEIGRKKPVNLMDLGTIAAKVLKRRGLLQKLDESDEINACTVKIKVDVEGKEEDYLLLFKNETHNHPTEIEPFGGAATCVGGAIRDPLSGRSYVYAAMRLTGAGNPLAPVSETIKGKLPQRKIVTSAAQGYSSYGNQIGLATGQVDELYHEGYVAKRLEIGAVIGAAPAKNVVRKQPVAGDKVILLGGRTGRDGCGGATGSSKSHTEQSLTHCGAEVQKGNAPEERKLQRLFRNGEATRLIKRCNDFGAGGVSVAIGELADGLEIDLDLVPKKYDGLDGTELAISESQERMAVVVSKEDAETFVRLAGEENLEATVVAEVTELPRLVMKWRGKRIVDLSREFLGSNGAEKHIEVETDAPQSFEKQIPEEFEKGYFALVDDLNVCSKKGLAERFDSTIGAGTVLMPFGGKYQMTPPQAMVHLIPMMEGHTQTVSYMSWGCNPYILEKSPYHGAYLAVVESLSKLVATGAEYRDVYLSFQEYFLKPGKNPKRWGQPFSALLGAFKAQMDFKVAAIGGKDSMSGTFEHIDVPPTLVSFAVTTGNVNEVVSPEFKAAGHKVALLLPEYQKDGLPDAESLLKNFALVHTLLKSGDAVSCSTPGFGGVAEQVLKNCLGNEIGFEYEDGIHFEEIFGYRYGAFLLELTGERQVGKLLGRTIESKQIAHMGHVLTLSSLKEVYESKLESVFRFRSVKTVGEAETVAYKKEKTFSVNVKSAKCRVLIPVFPGTNCEYDSERAFREAGAETKIFVVKNRTADDVARSVEGFASEIKKSCIVFLPGGFSGGDEPDGSGKFITAFFKNPEVGAEVNQLLKRRDGLMGGICNGFQALVKLGLVPFGEILEAEPEFPTLTYNDINRHQSKIVQVRIASANSPWLRNVHVGEIYSVPISHGEGKFVASKALLKKLAENGQIMTQYVDFEKEASMDIRFNPNGSANAVEGILSPDGRIFGKMGHAERIGEGLYRNVLGNYDMKLFESAVEYFK